MTEPEQRVLAVPLRAARWIESLHEDANGLVWTTKGELRAALAVEAVRPETDIDEERLARALQEVDAGAFIDGLATGEWWDRFASELAAAYRATPLAERPE